MYLSRSQPALGFIVSKYYGNSVERNLFKRRCRMLFRTRLVNRGVIVALIVCPKKQNIPLMDLDLSFGGLYENIFS